ncbi:Uncharacterised protein [Prevotella melaninogenica]|uniref:PH domain-containing protein n=1 Tax=Prevotella melaninogenica TaxID=28132 RepID=UPI0019567315|nr:PH domain-containing protein [Prevotella melaninogenica]VTY11317.1 Uncharacterised protein [Prevotella melaninogenica]
MIDTIIILLMSLPLIVLGSTIGPDSAINFGSRIPKAKLKSEEGLKRLRRIKIALILAGSFILVGGFACLAFHWEDYQLVVILIPEIVAIIYMLLQLYKIEKKRKSILVLMLSIIVILGVLLLIGTLPITGNDNNTMIRNDTLFIEGLYAKEIPIASITQVDGNAMVPDIKMRTNGMSVGEINVGHFQTKEGKNVLLYLHSDDTNVTHIKTKNNEDIYINFKDSALSVNFPNKLRAIYRQPTKGK